MQLQVEKKLKKKYIFLLKKSSLIEDEAKFMSFKMNKNYYLEF